MMVYLMSLSHMMVSYLYFVISKYNFFKEKYKVYCILQILVMCVSLLEKLVGLPVVHCTIPSDVFVCSGITLIFAFCIILHMPGMAFYVYVGVYILYISRFLAYQGTQLNHGHIYIYIYNVCLSENRRQ